MYKNCIFCQGDIFRPYKVILRPSKKTDPRVVYVFDIDICTTLHKLGSRVLVPIEGTSLTD